MSPFEYMLPFISILVGLAVADLAVSLHRLLRRRRRITWDWLPLVAALLVLMLILEFWWSFYLTGRLGILQNYGAFLFLALVLVIMFLLASAALPDSVPEEGLDLRSYYMDNRRYFWLLFAAFVGQTIVSQILVRLLAGFDDDAGVSSLLIALIPNVLLLAVVVLLAVSRMRILHAVLVPLLLGVLGWQWLQLRLLG